MKCMKIVLYLFFLLFFVPLGLAFTLQVDCPTQIDVDQQIHCALLLNENLPAEEIFGEQFLIHGTEKSIIYHKQLWLSFLEILSINQLHNLNKITLVDLKELHKKRKLFIVDTDKWTKKDKVTTKKA